MGMFSGVWDSIKDFFTGGSSSGASGTASRLYVGNLSYKATEDELRSLFAKHGRVRGLHLIRDKFTRRLKGYAFVEMSPEDAGKALVLNGTDFLGRKLVISIAKSRGSSSGSGGGRSSGHSENSGGSGSRRGNQNRWRRRRSGPRAYGQDASKDGGAPLQRYE